MKQFPWKDFEARYVSITAKNCMIITRPTILSPGKVVDKQKQNMTYETNPFAGNNAPTH